MKGTRKFSEYLKYELRNKVFEKAFNEEEPYANLAIQIAKLRVDKGCTQGELADLLHTTQQTISRIEDPHNTALSVNTLIKLAKIFHKRLKIQYNML